MERESTIAAENLATAEKQRDFATKQLSSQRLARKQLEALHEEVEGLKGAVAEKPKAKSSAHRDTGRALSASEA